MYATPLVAGISAAPPLRLSFAGWLLRRRLLPSRIHQLFLSGAAIAVGDPYSKKSPLPSIDTSPRLAVPLRIPVTDYLASQEYITDTTYATITLEY